MISAFTISKNVESQGYPYLESIQSFLPVIDEMIVVDSSTDGSTEKIQALSDKIRIVKEPWEDNWYYWRMNHNFDRGFRECRGDIVMKFDLDRVLHEDGVGKLKENFRIMLTENYLTLVASAISVPVVNRINHDKNQIVATNVKLGREQGMNLRFGVDLDYGLHNNIVDYRFTEHNLIFGKREYGQYLEFPNRIFNYGHCFMTKKQTLDLFYRIWNAPALQYKFKYKNEQRMNRVFRGFTSYDKTAEIYMNSNKNLSERISKFEEVDLNYHPEIIQDKIKNLKPEQRGYNWWGRCEKPSFLEAI